jgi:hypothetical protein
VTFDYSFGGLIVRSPIALAGLRPASASRAGHDVQLIVERGAAPVAERRHFAWPGRYGLRLGEYRGRWLMQPAFAGGFLIDRDGRTIRMLSDILPPPQILVDVLVRRVLPRVATLHGAVALHAAALADLGAGVILAGRSGAGKSTMVAAAALSGIDILSEDISVLWPEKTPMIAPAATGISVWPDTRRGLALDLARCSEMPGYGGKLRYEPDQSAAADTVPICAIIVLERVGGSEPPATARLSPLPKVAALQMLAPQMLRFNPAASQRIGMLVGMNRVLDHAAAWRLTYPSDFSRLSAAIDVLRQTMPQRLRGAAY